MNKYLLHEMLSLVLFPFFSSTQKEMNTNSKHHTSINKNIYTHFLFLRREYLKVFKKVKYWYCWHKNRERSWITKLLTGIFKHFIYIKNLFAAFPHLMKELNEILFLMLAKALSEDLKFIKSKSNCMIIEGVFIFMMYQISQVPWKIWIFLNKKTCPNQNCLRITQNIQYVSYEYDS